ncbi:RNA polymerase sigma factor [Flagellimonas meridianipacifica]|uniref:RNA polymerase sigma factor (Sigma-70 family) n=1 Tax=Flagellimonas meridianipacifica TaxID=1080225 RepID=A0A2T0MBT5_9FLAO|nr:sigma-70 family RNA polymerase sigma factor [Allomuricauda pacifica]PRX54946.1 RNA polymerase sigma factor (sigma-70 family) [Allomuricauda pacifica]
MENKNFGLTQADFDRLVVDLKRNDTFFFEQVFTKQFEETIVYLKRENRADHEDAYDATMDALIAFRLRFVQGKLSYGNLRFLFTKMASQMYLKSKRSKVQTVDNNLLVNEETVETENREMSPEFNKAWQKLGAGCKDVLTKYYYGKMKLLEIADELSKSPATVRKQKERCIKKMKELISVEI